MKRNPKYWFKVALLICVGVLMILSAIYKSDSEKKAWGELSPPEFLSIQIPPNLAPPPDVKQAEFEKNYRQSYQDGWQMALKDIADGNWEMRQADKNVLSERGFNEGYKACRARIDASWKTNGRKVTKRVIYRLVKPEN